MMVRRLKGKSRNFEKASLLTFTFTLHIFWQTCQVCVHMNMCRQAAMNFNRLTNSSLSSTCISTQRSYSMVTINSHLFLWSRQWSSKFRSIEKWNKSSSWVTCPKTWNKFLQWNFRREYSVMGIWGLLLERQISSSCLPFKHLVTPPSAPGNVFLQLWHWGWLWRFLSKQIIAWTLWEVHQACNFTGRFCWTQWVEGSSLKFLISSTPSLALWFMFFLNQSYKQCESCRITWKNLNSSKCGQCANLNAPQQPAPKLSKPAFPITCNFLSQNVYLILSDTQNLLHTAVDTARTTHGHAMEACLSKQLASQNLHTTAGLMAAKNTITNDNTVFISAQCHIKTILPRDQKNTDPAYSQWGKPWPKDTYMSSGSFLSLLYLLSPYLWDRIGR